MMIDSKNMTANERLVYAAVKDARIDNLKARKDIEKSTGITKRVIEKTVVGLRNRHGVPVYALKEYPHNGYFIATNEEERQAGLRAYRAQITTSQKNLEQGLALDLVSYWEAMA